VSDASRLRTAGVIAGGRGGGVVGVTRVTVVVVVCGMGTPTDASELGFAA
jgi:predicted metalloprotease